MFEYLQNWLREIENAHGVNPVIFAIIYCAGVIPFWLSIYKIISAIRNRDRKTAITFGLVLSIVIIAPFTYVAVFGHNLPVWFWIVAVAVVSYSTYSVLKRIHRTRTTP
jgi:hypothetical protein